MFAKWTSPAAVFESMKELSRGQPCDIAGVQDYAFVDRRGGVQWPYPEASSDDRAERRLFEDGKFYHPDGRAKFIYEEPRPVTGAAVASVSVCAADGAGDGVAVAYADADIEVGRAAKVVSRERLRGDQSGPCQSAGISPNRWVTIASQRGQMRATAVLTPTVAAGQLFIPMHYEPTNRLTDAVFDPYSKQPSYKSCAVRIAAE